jgi:hypothetical protein
MIKNVNKKKGFFNEEQQMDWTEKSKKLRTNAVPTNVSNYDYSCKEFLKFAQHKKMHSSAASMEKYIEVRSRKHANL